MDQLAKLAAESLRAADATLLRLDGGEAAAAHAACLLGSVTHAANNHQVGEAPDDFLCTDFIVFPELETTQFVLLSINQFVDSLEINL